MRLDRGSLDRSGLDRSFTGKIYTLYATIEGKSSVYANLFVPVDLYAVIEGKSSVDATLQVAQVLFATIEGKSSVYARLAVNTQTLTLTFTGTIAAGKTVCIDGRDFTVLNDGVNAMADFTGDFPVIYPGSNTVVWTDDEAGRTVYIAVRKKDRSV